MKIITESTNRQKIRGKGVIKKLTTAGTGGTSL